MYGAPWMIIIENQILLNSNQIIIIPFKSKLIPFISGANNSQSHQNSVAFRLKYW